MSVNELPPPPETISAEAQQAVAMMNAAAAFASASPVPEIAEWRAQTAQIQNAIGAMQRERYAVDVEHTAIAGVPVIIYRPAGGVRAPGILLNLHGGGFMLDSGSQTENIPLAALTGMQIVAVLYRLAPEHPFPAAVDDAAAVYGELLRTTAAKQIAVFGTSAGAVTSAQLMVRLRQINQELPAALGFFSGSADLARTGDSEHFVPGIAGQTLRQLIASYVGETSDLDPSISPFYAELQGFPPTLILTSTRDNLLSQSAIFHRALRRAGVTSDLIVFEALPHAFWSYLQCPETDEAFAVMADYFEKHLKS